MKQEMQDKMPETCAMNTGGIRDYALDNIRFFLIFCVVFGHLLVRVEETATSNMLYEIIYSFHMPAFLFLVGYNIKYVPQRIIFRWGVPYFVFQTAHILYAGYVLGNPEPLQYTTPYWTLWYLLAAMFYQILIPLYEVEGERRQILVLLISFVLALLVGFDKTIGRYMSLSRFFVFQPWFLLGFYCKKNNILRKLTVYTKIRSIISRIGVYGVLFSFIYLIISPVPYKLLYGYEPYNGYSITIDKRAILMVISLCWILFLFVVIKPYLNKKIPLITTIGQNTLPVYLMHGFVVKAIPEFCPVLLSTPWSILLLSCAILLVFGNKVCQKGIHYLCFGWLEKYLK